MKIEIKKGRPLFKNKDINKFISENIDTAISLKEGEYQKNFFNDNLFIISQCSLLKNFEEAFYESHKVFYDIHYIVEGQEIMALLNIDKIGDPYEVNVENDYFLYQSDLNCTKFVVDVNQFVIFDFEKVHKVGMKNSSIQSTKKIVIKIKKDFFAKEFINE